MDEFKKAMNYIEVPETTGLIIDEAVKKVKRLERIRAVLFITGIVPLCFIVFIGIGFVSRSVAQAYTNIPIIGSIFEESCDQGLKQVAQKGLTTKVNQTIEEDGVSITVNEVYCDDNRISVGFTAKGSGYQKAIKHMLLYVNDKQIWGAGAGFSDSLPDGSITAVNNLMSEQILPDKFTLRVEFKEDPEKDSLFVFWVPITLTQVNSLSWEHDIQGKASENNRVLETKKVKFTPSAVSIDFCYQYPNTEKTYSIYLVSEDGIKVQATGCGGGGSVDNGVVTEDLSAIFPPVDKHTGKFLLEIVQTDESGTPGERLISIEFYIKE